MIILDNYLNLFYNYYQIKVDRYFHFKDIGNRRIWREHNRSALIYPKVAFYLMEAPQNDYRMSKLEILMFQRRLSNAY